ncbi:MAG: hypothetical protein WBO00_04830 [Steroidobacteraceae bacterium]
MNSAQKLPACLTLGLLAACSAAAPPRVESTAYLGAFSGDEAPLHPDNIAPHHIAYYGTDLGFSYEHRGQLQFLFGDSWASEVYAPIEASTGSRFDDGFGSIDLAQWPDPARIARGNIPLIRLGQNPGTTEMSAIDPGHAMDLGKTPMGGFSNGTDEFGIFNITKPQGCRKDSDCSNGLSCDTTLGYFGASFRQEEGLTLGCRDGTPGCVADTMAGAPGTPLPVSGFCTDETSVMRGEKVSNLLNAIGLRVRIGLRDRLVPKKYGHSFDWLTNKFMNVTVRTAQDFSPGNGKPDYSPAGDAGGNRRVFLWGRPGFVGVAANGRSLALYFAYLDMPAGPDYAWKPMYYAGSSDGVPQFSAREQDAVPVDLDSTVAGVQAEESIDIVNQMSVSWVAPLRKWVMFYGGGLSTLPTAVLPHCGVLELFTGSECKDVVVGNGAVRMRTADEPWGPWTPPQDVTTGTDPANGAQGQYGPGGALRHGDCKVPGCAPHSDIFVYHPDEYGFFYAANIIEQWTRPAGHGVDIIWNASTWDPYRVVLLRTRISR